MKNTVIVLLVVALIVLVVGAVNQDQRVDLDYVFGTWNGVSVFALSAVVAAATLVLGVAVAAVARAGALGDRRKLERELEQVYPRLREAERAAGLPEWQPAGGRPVGTADAPPTSLPGSPPEAAAEGDAGASGLRGADEGVVHAGEPQGGEAHIGEQTPGPRPPASGPPPVVPTGGGTSPAR